MALDPAVLVKDDQDHLIHPLHHPSDHLEPMIYVRGRGAVLTDIQGREYIDGLAGLWNVNVGHGRAELAQAAAAQMSELAYYSGYSGSSNVPAIQLASKLISLAYSNLQAVFFTSGGAESNESAFKTARFYWKAQGKPDKVKIIARTLAYHGVTLQAMSATGMPPYWKMFEPRVPNFLHIPTCYPYRQEGARPGETAGQTAARLLEEAILREGADTVAGFIAEPIHGGGGVLYPTDDYFPLVRQVCDRHSVLFIADEVITGFCRTGRWFALEHWNVQPDILSFAKGVSSGYLPLGGIMVSRAIKETMDSVKPDDRWMHAYTYSGHPTCCAVGLANVAIMERERLWFAQTPQAFHRDWFARALARVNGRLARFPDDVSILEAAGYRVRIVPGDPLNIKVTTREDLLLAEAILNNRRVAVMFDRFLTGDTIRFYGFIREDNDEMDTINASILRNLNF